MTWMQAAKDSAARVLGNRALLKCDDGCGEDATAIVIELSGFSGDTIGQRFRSAGCAYPYWICSRCDWTAKSGIARVLFTGGKFDWFCSKCAQPGEVKP